jgi:4-diphosphocytidyl-2-C-methyl-D-erythritol kinase
VRQAAIAAVNSLGAGGAGLLVRERLRDADPRVRECAIRVAGYFGFDECLPELVDALDAPEAGVSRAAIEVAGEAGVEGRAKRRLEKRLPVAAGLGGGSADAAAALRLLTGLWGIDPAHASAVAPKLGADVPACLLNMTCRGDGAGDRLQLFDDPSIAGTPMLLVNPGVPLSTGDVFEQWDGVDLGPLGEWRDGRNDLEAAATALVPEIADVIAWLREQPGADVVRMSGSGATCFALFADESARESPCSTTTSPSSGICTRMAPRPRRTIS